ncbi:MULTISPECIES: DUF317 domain-containing protein [Streptomyces]|uniref:DUF317 domain-containing protein n=1 Tax=Streptomyces TaxID=1883 RepID=UPI00345C15C4
MKRQKWATWGPETPEQHYFVRPRHLAGGGNLAYVTEHLRASGWKDHTSHAGTPVVFDSPDRSVRLGYDPSTTPPGWTISGKATPDQPAWHATLSSRIPVEIVAGVTDALTQPRRAHAPNVWAPLKEQNWRTDDQGKHHTVTSPDGTAAVRFHQEEPGAAIWWATAHTEHGKQWEAVFSQHTPMHLVAAFTTALADPEPLLRPRNHIPTTQKIHTISVSALPSQIAARLRERITSARTTTWARTTTAARCSKVTPTASPYLAATKAARTR